MVLEFSGPTFAPPLYDPSPPQDLPQAGSESVTTTDADMVAPVQHETLLKVVVIGDSGVEKSSIMERFSEGPPPGPHNPL